MIGRGIFVCEVHDSIAGDLLGAKIVKSGCAFIPILKEEIFILGNISFIIHRMFFKGNVA
jgi:hypothetical protein